MSKLVSDITQFNVGDKRVYLSPLIDLFNGEILSWRVGSSPNVEFTLGMLADASDRLFRSSAIIHTDQGFQYQTSRWQNGPRALGCTQSMSRKGNCLDNACAESFFGRLKTEFSDGSGYMQPKRFITDLNKWIGIRGLLDGMALVEYRLARERVT